MSFAIPSSSLPNFNRDSTDEGYDEQKFESPAFMLGWSEEQRAEFAFQLLLTLPTSRLSNIHSRITPLLHRDFLSHLPYELSIHILSFTDHRTVARVAQTSKQWNKIALDQQLWRTFFLRQGWSANFDAMDAYLRACFDNGAVSSVVSGKRRAINLSGDDGVDSDGSDCDMDIDQEGYADHSENMLRGEGSSSTIPHFTSVINSSALSSSPPYSQGSSTTKHTHTVGPVSSTAMTRLHAIRRPSMMFSRLRRHNGNSMSSTSATPGIGISTAPSSAPAVMDIHAISRTLLKTSKSRQSLERERNHVPIPTMSIPTFTHLLPDHQLNGLPIINWKSLYKNRSLIEKHWREGQYQTRELPTHEKSHQEGIYCIQFDENKIVSGSRDNTIKIWDIKTGECLRTYTEHTASVLCLQYDDEWIVSGSSDTTIIVWRMEDGEVLKTLHGHSESVLNLRFDKRHIVSCSKDRTIKIWDAQTGAQLNTLTGHRAAVNAVQFKNGRVVSASGDRTIKLWDMATGKELKTFDSHSRGIACVQFDGARIVSGSSDRSIKVWDVESGQCLMTLNGHSDLVRTLQFDGASGRIVSGSYDETVKVWDLRTGRVVADLRDGHTRSVFKLQFNDTKIVSCSQDQKIIVWDFAAGVDTSFLT